mmetsp:Transcript_14688/g.25111  ORF Transcript_14688/g.25111 Transcript_14688/m.25111 type:complete len:222 (+) Transcript_14688:97-762(+)|eukprot:CAMPEP_0196655900 /NCGR_PEP_ID=MMETSP1086-20130531/10337_1 /TAXON_ID=77921 /ORGANISM="Cyanoptyche  gloeocystis , Strain SAG4.97" /LENGTH=221 /DNA_ID=CAMNT_0041988433 /DNA_START=93 /DNA_END=758 /DNA_ORIENTATION=-
MVFCSCFSPKAQPLPRAKNALDMEMKHKEELEGLEKQQRALWKQIEVLRQENELLRQSLSARTQPSRENGSGTLAPESRSGNNTESRLDSRNKSNRSNTSSSMAGHITQMSEEPLPSPIAIVKVLESNKIFEMNKKSMIIGRRIQDSNNKVDVDLADCSTAQKVSKKHAAIYVAEDGQFEVANFGKNGTYVDGCLYQHAVAVLKNNSKIQIGGCAMTFQIL